jgi:hypothetical protein
MSTPNAAKNVTSPRITQNRVKAAEFARNIHRATPEASTQFKDVLDPAYWAHVAKGVALYDTIEVVPDGGAWYAQLLVVGCSKLHVKVQTLIFVKLNGKDEKPATDAPFAIEFKGPQRKWSVIRVSDKSYAKEGFDSKEDAAKWLAENEADLTDLA